MSGSTNTLATHRRPPVGPAGAIPKKNIPSANMDRPHGSGRLRLARQLSSSQPKLAATTRRGSVDALLLEGRVRSNSLAKLTDLKRNLSASNLAALSDSNLSVQEAEPARSYDTPNTAGALAKSYLEQLVKRYYYQITEGCGNVECQNKFCRSSKGALKLAPDIAAIVSIQLASSQRLYFCSSEKFIGRALPLNVFQSTNGKVKSFLQALYSSSPFATLFNDGPKREPLVTIDGRVAGERRRKSCQQLSYLDHEGLDMGKKAFPARKELLKKLVHKPPSGKHSSTAALPTGSRNRQAPEGKGSNLSLPTQHSGSLGKLRGVGPEEVCSSGGDVLRWGSDHSLPITAEADIPWMDGPASRNRNGQVTGSGDDVNIGHVRNSSGLLKSRGMSVDQEDGLHTAGLSCSQENFSAHGIQNNHYRTRSSPVGSTSHGLLMNSGGSALSLTSACTPSSLSSNPMSVSPIPSPCASPAFSPAPSPLRLLSDQEALEETEDLREFERSLSLELDSGREFALTHLTLGMLQSIINQYKECDDDAFLINTIRTVFMSDAALNASFKVDERDPNSSLDLQAVQMAFSLLSGLQPKDRFMTVLANALEILLMRLDQTLIQPHQINQLLIVLECPLLEIHFDMVQVLCRLLAKHLTPGARSALVDALALFKRDRFQRILRIMQTHMVSMIRPKHGASEGMLHVATAIGIIYEANQVASKGDASKELAFTEDFYCHQLSRELDYQAEYHRWQVKASLSASNMEMSLLDFPFLLDPASKVHVLHLDAVVQMRREYQAAILHQARVNQAQKYLKDGRRFTSNLKDSIKAAMCPFLVLEVRRDYLISDTLAQIRLKKNDLKKPLKIKYIGGGEQGLDMGGLQKEFFQLISEAVFKPSYGMFVTSEENRTIWINGSGSSADCDDEFELVGTLLGLAIYNGIILDVHFPMALYKKLHSHTVTLTDLIGVQPSLGRGIKDLLGYEGEVEDVFCQTFQVSYSCMGDVITTDLIPNGSQVAVTNENREEFARLYVEHLLNDSIARQFQAFTRGFNSVCGGSALQLFQPSEIELLICGSPDLDFHALEASATYEDGFTRKHRTVLYFWRTVHSLDNEWKKKLLHFITGSDRVPLKGLSSLAIVIQRNGPHSDRLPTAMTCFNRLLLPEYNDQTTLRQRLLLAVQYGKGFGLT
ncbi:probable E3 ubiquitin-protein ligase HERC4 [Diadema setosum]|uniref:probable E3 ubiquitin-protein ligase HERC4 n=1 Tax=Diadema setosum TaxID=31175 RepID=UPI003B3AC8B0